jgi:hydrophobe/amphiphile efflux-1 (HAE1) family protein
MRFSSWFIGRPIATSLLMVSMLGAGLAVYPLLPVAPLPEADLPTIQVTTQLPGASPETIASSVTQPLERQFGEIPGITQMTSVSTLGASSITLQFDLSRTSDSAAQDVQTAINAASGQLPANLAPPTYRKTNPSDAPIIVLAVTSDAMPLTAVDDFAENVLEQRISQVLGVGNVLAFGQQKPAVRIQVDPAKVSGLGLSLEDIRTAIVASTVNSPKGAIQGMRRTFTIYGNDQLLSAAPWKDQVIAYRQGAPVRVRDIGQAIDGPENNQLAAWSGLKPAILLAVFKLPGANVIETVDKIKLLLPQLRAEAPAALNIDVLSDRTTTIRASVKDVEKTLVLTVVLVIVMIFLFLRSVTATAVPSVTVPLALVAAFAVMYPLGYSLDNLSLMGLSIAIGFVVDDAIVILENIQRHVDDGKTPFAAANIGANEIGFTIISISLSLIAVFIPLLLMGGAVGRLFREFAVVVTITIAVSAFVSLTLTPMLCARFLRPEKSGSHGRFYRWLESGFDALAKGYGRTLDMALRWHKATFCVFLGTMALTVVLFVYVPKGFFPIQDTGLILGVSEGNQDTSFANMVKHQLDLGRVVLSDPDVATVGMTVGALAGQTLNNGRMFITLKPRDERTASATDIINRLGPKLAKIEGAALFLQAAQDVNIGARASRTQFQYSLQDSNINELNQWAPQLLAKLKALPQLADVATDQQTDGTAITLAIDRDQASRFGISPELIDNTLYDAFGQRQVTQYFTQLNSYHVILEVLPELQNSPTALDQIYITSPITGGQVPLKVLVKVSTENPNFLSINHQNQFPSVTLSFNLAPGYALSDAVNAIRNVEKTLDKPRTLLTSFQGNAQAFQTSLATEPYLVVAALAVIYVILGVLYESLAHPITILSTLPSAGLGALAMLWGFGFDFTLIALIGVILLIGIVKKNGIMLVDFALVGERELGLSPMAAIRRACLLRFRPIMMTTMAALLGGVPLIITHGTGSELRQPLGYAIVGGLIVSQALTLYTTPVIYLYLDRLNGLISRRRGKFESTAATTLSETAAVPIIHSRDVV